MSKLTCRCVSRPRPASAAVHGLAHAGLVDVAHVEDLEAELVDEALLAEVDAADADLADVVRAGSLVRVR